ncbi:MAG: HAD family hydrolase [Desulfovibrionaceae bacterium]|nr:HAD family hydrolase [Desulfovibrionaceae bacterium]
MLNSYQSLRKAIFLDRDGTINENTGYVHRIEDFKWLPGAIEALKILHQANYLLIVVSNQSGIARHYYTEEDLHSLEEAINQILQKEACPIRAFYHCPHLPLLTGPCKCRKPEPGMILQAMVEHHLNHNLSWMIGDHLSDVEAGFKAQVKTIKLGEGLSLEDQKAKELGALIFKDLYTAAKFIVSQA